MSCKYNNPYCNFNKSCTCYKHVITNKCPDNSCTDDCGCLTQTKGSCVFYQGTTTPCLNITKGDNYDKIITTIDSAICSLNPASGNTTTVVGTNNQIVSTPSASGNNKTFTLSLSPSVLNRFSSIESNITSLQTCCNSSLKTITTNTPSYISLTSASGNVNIQFNPSVYTNYSGIVLNDKTLSRTTGINNKELLKTFSRNYSTLNQISDYDEISFVVEGFFRQDIVNRNSDYLIVDLYDSVNGVVLYSTQIRPFIVADIISFDFKSSIDVYKTENKLSFSGIFSQNNTSNGNLGDVNSSGNQSIISKEITISTNTLNNLTINIYYGNTSSTIPNNGISKFKVRVEKYI